MTRDSQLPADPPEEPDQHPGGNLATTGPGLLLGCFLTGLVVGRLIEPLGVQLDGTAPRVGWLAVFALYFAAAILGYVAWSTRRTILTIRANQAVNRLVLAKACAIAGAFLAGGYSGYALTWVAEHSEFARERLGHSLLAAVACALIVAGSLVLERACRVRGGSN